jgi:hypothetical protein
MHHQRQASEQAQAAQHAAVPSAGSSYVWVVVQLAGCFLGAVRWCTLWLMGLLGLLLSKSKKLDAGYWGQ